MIRWIFYCIWIGLGVIIMNESALHLSQWFSFGLMFTIMGALAYLKPSWPEDSK